MAKPGRSVSNTVLVRNRQRIRPVDARLLRSIARALLRELLQARSFDIGIYVVAATEMTRLNETFLRHQGSTDVLAFDYADVPRATELAGEIFICVDEALIQAGRFHTSWQSELVRYVVHGILHLTGHDDRRGARRRKMKREENRLLRELGSRFPFSSLERGA